jgi:hypothetical protein
MFRTIRWALIALLWTGYLYLAYFLSVHGRFGLVDFRVYYNSARMLVEGQNPYQGLLNYLYPPLLAQLLMPLASATTMETAWIIWFAFNVLVMWGTIGLLNRYVSASKRWLVWLMPVLFWAFLEALVVGQVTIILMALFAFAWAAAKENRPGIAGAILAFAAWLKLYPVLFIIYFAWKRNWMLVGSAAIWVVALALVQIAISGTTPFFEMIPVLSTLSNEGQVYLASANASVFGFASQLFEDNAIVQPLSISPAAYLISRIGLTIGILAGTFYCAAQSPAHWPNRPLDNRFNLEYALVLTCALLLSPTLWVSGMPPLALVYFLLWHSRPPGRKGRYIGWFSLIACMTLTVYYFFIIGYSPDPPQSGLLLSFGFYTILLTWGLMAYLLLRERTVLKPAVQVESTSDVLKTR